MQSELPKALFSFKGKPMLQWVLEAMGQVQDSLPPIVVVGHKGELVRNFIGNAAQCIEQKEINGTATAVASAMPHVPKEVSNVFIMYVDHPLITPESINAIQKRHAETGATITLGTVRLPDFNDWRGVFISFGRVIRDPKGEIAEIVEYKNANELEQKTLEINPGFYCADAVWLDSALTRIEANKLTGEYYLTDILALALYDNKKIESVPTTPVEALGINSVKDAEQAEALASN